MGKKFTGRQALESFDRLGIPGLYLNKINKSTGDAKIIDGAVVKNKNYRDGILTLILKNMDVEEIESIKRCDVNAMEFIDNGNGSYEIKVITNECEYSFY